MIRLVASAAAIGLFVSPLLVTPVRPVAVVGGAGLLLSAVAIAVPWRRAATAAGIVFSGEYALALVLGPPGLDLVRAGGFGVALVLLIQWVDLACRARSASVHTGVVASHVRRAIALAAATAAALALALVTATAVASAMPRAAAPFLAAIGALGAIGTAARAIARRESTRLVRRRGITPSAAP